MASPFTHKRPRAATRKNAPRPFGERYIVDAQGKRVAVVLDLAEYRRLAKNGRAASRAASFDWLAEARRVRALAPPAPDSTPILRDLREGRLR